MLEEREESKEEKSKTNLSLTYLFFLLGLYQIGLGIVKVPYENMVNIGILLCSSIIFTQIILYIPWGILCVIEWWENQGQRAAKTVEINEPDR